MSSPTPQPTHTIDTFRPLLKALTLSIPLPTTDTSTTFRPRPPAPPLTPSQLQSLFSHLSDPTFTADVAHHAMLGAALTSMRLSGLDSTPEALAMASRTFLEKSIRVAASQSQPSRLPVTSATTLVNMRVRAPEDEDEGYQGYVDMVGTGGDGQDTFNVSTTAAMVAAGVEGVKVTKHGARASSSTSGSADLLISLGVPLTDLLPSLLLPLLPSLSFTFLFAQLYHPSLAPLAPIRRSIGFPTIFNVLGPLINPAEPARCVLGVHSPYLGSTYAEALRERGTERAWVVCGKEGLDEISCEGETDVWELQDGQITHFVISPASFAMPSHPLTSVASQTSHQNASIVLRLLSKRGEASLPSFPLSEPLPLDPTQKQGGRKDLSEIPSGVDLRAIADYTILQAAALLYVAGKAKTLPSAAELARKSMNTGAALEALDQFAREATLAVEGSKEGGKEK